jgi:LuxR family maltose regulon positive regulatory protein
MKATVKDSLLWVDTAVSAPIPLASTEWTNWLAANRQFKFKGTAGHFSARRETRHGGDYWYAYRRRSGKLHKAYLGKTEELNLTQLEETAAALAGKTNFNPLALFIQPQNAIVPVKSSIHTAFPAITKIRPPILPPTLITRPRLTQKLQTPVTFICAPGGFGKSTLLNAWQQECCNIPIAWASLDADDNHLIRFWTTVVMAIKAVVPGFRQGLLQELQLSAGITPGEIVARLSNEIVNVIQETAGLGLILDDYHHIQHADIHNSIQIWLEHLPPGLQLIISGRTRPPIALGCVRARGLVTELEMEDLRFTREEGVEFLQQHVADQPLAHGDMETLVNRTSGWAAGLMLAVLALNKHQDRQRFLESFNGAHIFLREYFLESVLHQQTDEVKTFLLKTSILKQLTGSLCDALTGHTDGAEMLARLWQENLFLVRAEEQAWYTYHDLFAEMLSNQLETQYPNLIPNLHRRAAAWYREQNGSAEAVRHLLAIKDWEDAASLIEEVVLRELVEYGEDSRLLRWIQQLPESVFQHHKTLLFVYLRLAKLALSTGEVERFLRRLEHNLMAKPQEALTDDEREVLAEIRTIQKRKTVGDLSISQAAPADSRWQLLDALWIVEASYLPQTDAVGVRLYEVYEQSQAQGNLFVLLIAGADSANRALMRGHLRESEKIVFQVLQYALSQRGKLPEPASIALITLSHIYRLRNELAEAHQLVQRATAVDPNPTSSNMPINIAIARAKLQATSGNHEEAIATIQAARALQAQRPSGGWRDQDLAVFEAMFNVPLENWTEVERLLGEGVEEGHGLAQLVRADVFLRHKQPAAAEKILERLLRQFPNGITNEPMMQVRVLLGLALFEQHKLNQARQVMTEAVRLAAPERLLRPFLTPGTALIPLLALLRHTESFTTESQQFLLNILQLLGCPDQTTDWLPQEKLESLKTAASITEREQEVLKLVSSGLSNREIGVQLCITPGTVKTHLANIYDKLDVHCRTQAIAEARTLQLI